VPKRAFFAMPIWRRVEEKRSSTKIGGGPTTRDDALDGRCAFGGGASIANSRAIITSTGHDDCRLTRRDGRENEIFVGAADGWRCLSLSWRAPMREPEERVPIGLPLRDMTINQFMDIEDSWSMREDRV
jgi:hypothetical protein